MYKRIVHNIIEEHFDHFFGIPKVSVSDGTGVMSELQMTTTSLFKDLALNIRAYIVSVLISADDSDVKLSKTISNIEGLGALLGGYYGADRVSGVVIHLKEFVDFLGRIANMAKQGYDYTSDLDLALTHINLAADKISELNPEHWPESVVKKYLRLYAGLLMNQIVANISKDGTSEIAAINFANSLMFIGPVNLPYYPRMPSFSEFIATGIFKRFPGKF